MDLVRYGLGSYMGLGFVTQKYTWGQKSAFFPQNLGDNLLIMFVIKKESLDHNPSKKMKNFFRVPGKRNIFLNH